MKIAKKAIPANVTLVFNRLTELYVFLFGASLNIPV